MAEAGPGRRAELTRRRDAKAAEVARWEAEREVLLRDSPERRALLRVDAEVERWRTAVGLDREEARLTELQRARGRGSGRGGASFEEVALAVARRCIVPDLASGDESSDGSGEPSLDVSEDGDDVEGDGSDDVSGDGLRVLRGVTLGAARTELDGLVVRPSSASGLVEVLAVVEAKRNPNDLAHGFRQRQADLGWLTGDTSRYDPAEWRTAAFPSGHFDRPAVHREGGERWELDRGSFAAFRPDPATGHFVRGVYLVTRPGTLWGVSGAALGRIAHRVATDVAWDAEDDAYLADLLAWARSLAGETEAPEVVRLFARDPAWARQLLLVGR